LWSKFQVQENASSNSSTMEKFEHGEYAKRHPLFSTDKSALQLLFYYDGFEVVNPLGSKTNTHHMGDYSDFLNFSFFYMVVIIMINKTCHLPKAGC